MITLSYFFYIFHYIQTNGKLNRKVDFLMMQLLDYILEQQYLSHLEQAFNPENEKCLAHFREGRFLGKPRFRTTSEKQGLVQVAGIRLLPLQFLLLQKLSAGKGSATLHVPFFSLLKLLEEEYGPALQEEFVLQDSVTRLESQLVVHYSSTLPKANFEWCY